MKDLMALPAELLWRRRLKLLLAKVLEAPLLPATWVTVLSALSEHFLSAFIVEAA